MAAQEYIIGTRLGLLDESEKAKWLHMTLAYMGVLPPERAEKVCQDLKEMLPRGAFYVNLGGENRLGENKDIRVIDCVVPDFVVHEGGRFLQAVYDRFGVKQPFHAEKAPCHHYHITPGDYREKLLQFSGFWVTHVFVKPVGIRKLLVEYTF